MTISIAKSDLLWCCRLTDDDDDLSDDAFIGDNGDDGDD